MGAGDEPLLAAGDLGSLGAADGREIPRPVFRDRPQLSLSDPQQPCTVGAVAFACLLGDTPAGCRRDASRWAGADRRTRFLRVPRFAMPVTVPDEKSACLERQPLR